MAISKTSARPPAQALIGATAGAMVAGPSAPGRGGFACCT